MNMNRSLVAAVALIAAIASSALGAHALAAPTGASPFELTLEYQLPWAGPWGDPGDVKGTFEAGAPFCRSGRFDTLAAPARAAAAKYRFSCDDGSGTLVASASVGPFDVWTEGPGVEGSFRILEGTGSYTGLRGQGSQRSEWLSKDPVDPECVAEYEVVCPWVLTWRSTLRGVAGEDAVAPTAAFSSVKVTKLPRPAGTYSLDLALALRDDAEGNPVSYLLRVTPAKSGRELARSFGTTRDGTVSMTMRIRDYKAPKRALLLRLSASDEVGNESSVSRRLQLPR